MDRKIHVEEDTVVNMDTMDCFQRMMTLRKKVEWLPPPKRMTRKCAT